MFLKYNGIKIKTFLEEKMRIGIDVGATGIAGGIVDSEGCVIRETVLSTIPGRGYGKIVMDIAYIINTLKSRLTENGVKIENVGVGIPGLADENGDVIYCVNLGWKGEPLGRDLKKLTGLEAFIENDANAAALAEHAYGSMKGVDCGVMLTLGSGVGGGIIIGGRLHRGFGGVAGEIGHMAVGENFYNCTCGRNGCLETFASARALERYFMKLVEYADEESSALQAAGGSEKVDARLIFEAAKHGDLLSLMAVSRLARYLAKGIVNIINIIDPQVIVLGGGVSKAGDFLLDMTREQVERELLYKGVRHAQIKLAAFGDKSGIVGASLIPKYNTNPKGIIGL